MDGSEREPVEETRYTTPTTSVSGECYNLCISPPYNLPETSINLLKTSPKLRIYVHFNIQQIYAPEPLLCLVSATTPYNAHKTPHTTIHSSYYIQCALHSTPLSCTYSGAQIVSREAENTGTQAAAIMGSGRCVQPQTRDSITYYLSTKEHILNTSMYLYICTLYNSQERIVRKESSRRRERMR